MTGRPSPDLRDGLSRDIEKFVRIAVSGPSATILRSSASTSSEEEGATRRRKVLVVGGTGRVGGSAARHVHVLSVEGDAGGVGVELLLGGRSLSSFESGRDRIVSQLRRDSVPVPPISFLRLDLTNPPSILADMIRSCGADGVVNTAGPFQRRTTTALLEACIEAGVPYVDVCDEPALCAKGRELSDAAGEKGIAAVTAAGIWPGASALMVARAADELRRLDALDDADSDGSGGGEEAGRELSEVDVVMSFFTAGTGNAGATIVSATFLLLCQSALTVVNGDEVEKEPWTEPLDVDFGGDEGVKRVRLLDNPDVFTLYRSVPGVRNLCSRFATAPGLWNQLFGAMKALIPKEILSDTDLMQGLSVFSLPIIRAVDLLVGATNAMRVDVTSARSGRRCKFSVTHKDLEQCVGLATAAFILELMDHGGSGIGGKNEKDGGPLTSTIRPGVYYPAELPLESRERILELVRRDAIVWDFETS